MLRKPLLLTVSEVSKILRINRSKVYILIRENHLDGFKLGADWRVRFDSVEKLVGDIPMDIIVHKGTSVSPEGVN